MVLVNALYLEADWARPFGKYPTEDAPFTRLDGSTVTVPLMHELELTGPAVATDEYAATELPYEGGELSMLVIVPEDRTLRRGRSPTLGRPGRGDRRRRHLRCGRAVPATVREQLQPRPA
jgi:hypothetical protein